MDAATYARLGIAQPFEQKPGRSPFGSGGLNINDEKGLIPRDYGGSPVSVASGDGGGRRGLRSTNIPHPVLSEQEVEAVMTTQQETESSLYPLAPEAHPHDVPTGSCTSTSPKPLRTCSGRC